ncbi:O-antigen ligase [Rhizobium sp. PP-F2F-G38]|nr:O-antigen ligase [Rhizobium sp. PP-WC-1G-195]PYE99396.1 O-antigen ligase [Rhizobium sp. PP-F2F-G38]
MSISNVPAYTTLALAGAVRSKEPLWLRRFLEFMLCAFLAYVFTDGTLIAVNTGVSDMTTLVLDSGEGDSSRQIFYIGIAIMLFLIAARHGLRNVVSPFPTSVFVVVFWCFCSVSWAIIPDISLRRAILATIIIFATITIVSALGPLRVTQLLYRILAFFVVANMLSVVLLPGYAIHSERELDTALVGAWHGLMPHKNIASAVTALSAIVFGYHAFLTRSWKSTALLVLSIIFLLGTRGKTSLGIVVPCLFAGIMYNHAFRTERQKFLMFASIFLFLAGLAVFAMVFTPLLAQIFDDPTSFTGRVAIWDIVLRYVEEYPMTGAGFGSFWLIGQDSPILRIGGDMPWLFGIAHSHNGYLEMLVTTGVPGLMLTVIMFVIVPFYSFVMADPAWRKINGLYFGIWLFAVIYNLLETHIMNRDRQVWVIMLIAIQVAFLHRKREPGTGPRIVLGT